MKILGYPEVNGQQVLELNLKAFGWFLSPQQIEIIQRVDSRVQEYVALYAVENEKVQSQVGVVILDTLTTEGIEKVGYIWGVATRPSSARQGYASKLMEEAQNRMREDGIRYVFLGTGKSMVAYYLYRKFGYEDFTIFKRGMMKGTTDKTDGISLKTNGNADIIVSLFKEYSKECLGFVKRPQNFMEIRCAWSWFQYDHVGIFYDGEMPIGYVIASKEDKLLKLWEICCPERENLKRCISVLCSNMKVEHIVIDLIDKFVLERQFGDAGFIIFDESWGILMVKDLTGSNTVNDIQRIYGLQDNRFHMTRMDEY